MTLSVDVVVARGALRVHATLDAGEGETVALLGPNGSGKSTIVACLAGLLPPDEGTISLDGRTLDDAALRTHVLPEERPIGVVFQDGLLFPHLSAVENAAFPLRARGMTAPRGTRTGARAPRSAWASPPRGPMRARRTSPAVKPSAWRSHAR